MTVKASNVGNWKTNALITQGFSTDFLDQCRMVIVEMQAES